MIPLSASLAYRGGTMRLVRISASQHFSQRRGRKRSRKFAQLWSYTGRYSYVQDREMSLSIQKNLIIHSRCTMVPRSGRLVGPGLYGALAL
jgi:hypothetical protein